MEAVIETNRICHVFGYTDCCKITAISREDMTTTVFVETQDGKVSV